MLSELADQHNLTFMMVHKRDRNGELAILRWSIKPLSAVVARVVAARNFCLFEDCSFSYCTIVKGLSFLLSLGKRLGSA